MTIKVGDKLPEATFMEMTADGPETCHHGASVRRQDDCPFRRAGRLYADLLGPATCRVFVDKSGDFKAKGVDELVCNLGQRRVRHGRLGQVVRRQRGCPDARRRQRRFRNLLGLELDASGFGMGKRSQRYSMLVKDGVVAELNVEQGGGIQGVQRGLPARPDLNSSLFDGR